METTRRIGSTMAAAALALTIAACGTDDATSGDESASVTLTATNLLPPADAQSEMIQWFMDELEARTDGAVETEVVHGGALVSGDDTLPALRQGRADAGNVVHAYFPADLPLHNVSLVPVDGDQATRLRAFQTVFNEVEAWTAELERNDLVLVGYLPNTSETVTFNMPVERLSDLDGAKLRVSSQTIASVWDSFGVESVFMPSEEVYEAVERGIVDGTFYPMGTQIATGITDVAKFMAPMVGQSGSGTFAFTSGAYDSLPDHAKDVFVELQQVDFRTSDCLI